MLRYFISSLILCSCYVAIGQDNTSESQAQDSISYSQPYGLRAGIDLSRPILMLFNDDYTGFEIVADYRITQKLFLAAELGNEKRSSNEELGNINNPNIQELYNFTTSGSYLKLGVDLNTYENWYGMNNSIYIGGRYAASTFSQTLNSYNFFDSNRYWSPDELARGSSEPIEFSGLNATWLEFVFGVKTELFANFFLGASVRLGYLVSNKESDAFPNLWIPGFNKVNDGSRFGVGYNYSITYFLPFYKKAKKKSNTPSN